MKRLLALMVGLLIISGLLLTGCVINSIQGTGPIMQTNYDFKDFAELEISSSFEFDITRADTYSISVSTHENIVQYLDVSQSGKTVRIGLKAGRYTNSDIKATITMPDLTRLNISGATRGTAKGFASANNLNLTATGASQLTMDFQSGNTTITVSGASQLTGKLKAQDININVSGASRCEISGVGATGKIDISGASRFPSPDFQMQNANVTVSGASSADISASGDLGIDASGASSLNYTGNPNIKSLNVSGASRVNKR